MIYSQRLAFLFGEMARLNREICVELGGNPDSTAPPRAIGDDTDLDSAYGNRVVSYDPRAWTGLTAVGKLWSECTPEYLDVLAASYDVAADNSPPGKEKNAAYDRHNAIRARGWAVRIRNGWKP